MLSQKHYPILHSDQLHTQLSLRVHSPQAEKLNKGLPVTIFISSSTRTESPLTSTTGPLYPLKGPKRILTVVPNKESSLPPLPPLPFHPFPSLQLHLKKKIIVCASYGVRRQGVSAFRK